METQESGIDCEKPYYSKIFDQVESPMVDFSGIVKFCPETRNLIHLDAQISFVNIDTFLEGYRLVESQEIRSIPMNRRILEEAGDKATDSVEGGQDAEGATDEPIKNEEESSEPIEGNEPVDEGTSDDKNVLKGFRTFDPFVIDYNDSFKKVKDTIDLEKGSMFHIVRNYEMPEEDPMDLFLFLFQGKGFLLNIKNSINHYIDLKIQDHIKNEIVVSRCFITFLIFSAVP